MNFENICRFSLKQDTILQSIFTETSSVPQQILLCTSLLVNKGDGLPDTICKDCVIKLSIAYDFRNKCLDSEALLLEQLKLDIQETKDVIKIESHLINYIYTDISTDNDFVNSPIKQENKKGETNGAQARSKVKKCRSTSVKSKINVNSNSDNYKKKVWSKIKPNKKKQIINENDQNSVQIKPKTKRVRKPKQCQVCGKICIWLRTHMLTHTGVKAFKCEYCGKSFTQLSHYKCHINIHTGNKPYLCDICGKGFADPASKRSHLVTHTKERNYKCSICEKTFGYSHTLSAHKRIHTQDRKHICSVCQKAFLSKYSLTKHLRIHTGEKPYKCDFCDKRFSTSGNIQTHKRIHTRERPYKCDHCDMTFAYRSVLHNHEKKHSKLDKWDN